MLHSGPNFSKLPSLCAVVADAKLPERNTRRSANVVGSPEGGRVAVLHTESGYFLSSDVCNILLYLQLCLSCFSKVQAEKTNLFCSGNMFQSTCSESCRVSQTLMMAKTTKMAFHSTVFIHNCGAFAEFIVYCEQTSCNHSLEKQSFPLFYKALLLRGF